CNCFRASWAAICVVSSSGSDFMGAELEVRRLCTFILLQRREGSRVRRNILECPLLALSGPSLVAPHMTAFGRESGHNQGRLSLISVGQSFMWVTLVATSIRLADVRNYCLGICLLGLKGRN